MNVNSVITSDHFSPGARKKSLPLHVSVRAIVHVHNVDGYHLTWWVSTLGLKHGLPWWHSIKDKIHCSRETILFWLMYEFYGEVRVTVYT